MIAVRVALALSAGFLAFSDAACSFQTRDNWGARDAPVTVKFGSKPSAVVVREINRPGYNSACISVYKCSKEVKNIQSHYVYKERTDLPCNFLIGGDGNVYEGTGWDVSAGLGDRLAICVIGKFEKDEPKPIQKDALENIISCAASQGKVMSSYKLTALRDFDFPSFPNNPGQKLYSIVKGFDRYSS